MDFMKVLDQTVREIKREVNLKVLKVPEIEQKVLDATSDEPWGPHGSALSELAQATKKFTECQMIMNVLWTRLGDKSAHWRHIYKALAVIEYLIANGSERAIDSILEQSHQISSLTSFEYVEPNGKDVGINVRKKVETILALLEDKEKIQAVRNKAAATRDKYFGLSSTGITYKSSLASGNNFGTSSGTREDEFLKDSFKYDKHSHRADDDHSKLKEGFSKEKEGSKLKKGKLHSVSNQKVSTKPLAKPDLVSSTNPSSRTTRNNDELDDFDPRGSSSKPDSSNISSPQLDLFGGNLVDLLDVPSSAPASSAVLNATTGTIKVDLFADAAFVSAAPPQENIDLFANHASYFPAAQSNENLFAAVDSELLSETKSSNPTNISSSDPFSASDSFFLSKSKVDGSDDLFGSFTSSATPKKDSSYNSLNNMDQISVPTSQPAPKSEAFQVKSAIWADSLSRGLIDLNITAPKKTSLADMGIFGGLNDEHPVLGRAAHPLSPSSSSSSAVLSKEAAAWDFFGKSN